MYLCICNQVKSSDILTAIAYGYQSVNEIKDYLGIAKNCGSCSIQADRHIQKLLAQSLRQPQLIPLQVA